MRFSTISSRGRPGRPARGWWRARGPSSSRSSVSRDQIHSAVDRLSLLPADFDVLCHERSLAAEDGIDYAGIRLTGRVDRVDVNEESRRFVVLDYKGDKHGLCGGHRRR